MLAFRRFWRSSGGGSVRSTAGYWKRRPQGSPGLVCAVAKPAALALGGGRRRSRRPCYGSSFAHASALRALGHQKRSRVLSRSTSARAHYGCILSAARRRWTSSGRNYRTNYPYSKRQSGCSLWRRVRFGNRRTCHRSQCGRYRPRTNSHLAAALRGSWGNSSYGPQLRC